MVKRAVYAVHYADEFDEAKLANQFLGILEAPTEDELVKVAFAAAKAAGFSDVREYGVVWRNEDINA
jgi:hypothetical protein